MLLGSSLALLFIASGRFFTTSSAAPQELEPRAGGVCGSGIYGEVVPIVSGYSIAQSFCSSYFPVKCTPPIIRKRALTTTTTKTTTKPPTTTKAPTTTKTTTTSPVNTRTPSTTVATTTTKTTTTTIVNDLKASAWSKCQKQASSVISTICSCIETPKPCPTVCSDNQNKFCEHVNEFCAIRYIDARAVCLYLEYCPFDATDAKPACRVDADCDGVGDNCIYDNIGFCPGGRYCGFVENTVTVPTAGLAGRALDGGS